MRPHRPFVVVAALIVLVYLAGWLGFIDRNLLDARARVWSRPASGDLVVVAIDSTSLRMLAQWPWPRRHHAQGIRALIEAGASRIAYDIVFSSPSTPEDDAILSAALATAGPERIALPVFRQWRQTQDRRIEPLDTAPLNRFLRHASPASINVEPDADGLVRHVRSTTRWAGRDVPTMPAWLSAGEPTVGDEVLLDFSIDVRSIPSVSFSEILRGSFDPELIRGRRVLVGAIATELGDWISVPRHRALPGPFVQALAFETLAQGRALQAIRGWPVAIGAAFLILVIGPIFGRLPWRRALLLFAGSVLLISAAAAALQVFAAIALDTSASLVGLVLVFVTATLGRVENQAHALAGQIGALPAKDDMMRQLVDNSFDAIVTFRADGNVLSCNRAAERIFGVPAASVIGRPLRRALSPGKQGGSFAALADAGGVHELPAIRGDGRCFPVEATFSRIRVDEKWVGIAILRDITERKAHEAELERMALHDGLTGLPNRTLLNDRIEHAIRSAQRDGDEMAVLLLDLDRFKDLNDTLGHHVGDLLLTEVGPRLQQPLRGSDTVARLGGDEFAILLLGPADLEMACRIAERIVEALRQPFAIQELTLEVGVSIGVALYPDHGTTAHELLQHADVAMYAAKRDQLGFVVYSAESDTHSVRQLTLTGQLRRAIEDNQMVLEFQPKINARTADLAGVEALVRWQHPDHGAIPPNEFIHSAEQTGLIKPLTLWVLNAALGALHAWRQDGQEFGVAVNLSVKSLHDPQLPETVRLLLQSWRQRPELLTFEITESALMADPATALEVLARISEIGCRLSLDDFGTGYSSLAYLQKLPINELKIDRSFVVAMTRDVNAAVIVRSVVKLAKGLGLSVVAEGVESEEAFARLRSLGCDHVQGFLFGPSMAADHFQEWLRTSPWTRSSEGRPTLAPAS
jgi:diguanylate cyclase (GGDEF)-like protein/PAS domain S-box-containing protein